MYGTAQDDLNAAFLWELVNLAKDNLHPFEKSNDRIDNRWPVLFNALVDNLDSREVLTIGRLFNWVNCLPQPTLDRVLMDTDWE